MRASRGAAAHAHAESHALSAGLRHCASSGQIEHQDFGLGTLRDFARAASSGEFERVARAELDAIGVHRAARDVHIRAPSRRKLETGVFGAVEQPAVDPHILVHAAPSPASPSDDAISRNRPCFSAASKRFSS